MVRFKKFKVLHTISGHFQQNESLTILKIATEEVFFFTSFSPRLKNIIQVRYRIYMKYIGCRYLCESLKPLSLLGNEPIGGVPVETGNEYGDAGALRAPECPRHRGDSGGRKLPPPTVRQMRHAGTPEGAEQAAPGYRTVPQGDRTEETEAGGGGDAGEFGAGV